MPRNNGSLDWPVSIDYPAHFLKLPPAATCLPKEIGTSYASHRHEFDNYLIRPCHRPVLRPVLSPFLDLAF
jgi:hypothetical protein